MMRAVVVPAGVHEVVFEYRPASVRAGFATSAVGLVLLVVGRRRWLAL
jgi:hypothetical protein